MAIQSDTSVVVCVNCGQKNRVQSGRSRVTATCGRCKADLRIGDVVAATDSSFSWLVDGSSLPVVVDCWAPWCGPCRAVAPIIEELAAENPNAIRFAKLNVDENPSVAAKFAISSIPTLLLFRDARLVDRVTGARPKAALVAELRRVGFIA